MPQRTFEKDYWSFEERIRNYNLEGLRKYYDDVLDDIIKELETFDKHPLILDIGCGYGYFMQICAERACESLGIDVSRYAVSKISNRPANVILCDVQCGFPLKSKIADVVTMLDVVEHLDKIQVVLKEVKRVLKPKGLLYISTPNLAAIMRLLKGRCWYGFLDKTHISLFTPIQLEKLLKNYNFQVVKCYTPFTFSPLPKVVNKIFGHLYIGGQIRLIAQNQ
jgi:2-polyprenyl-3-methyl-5-hydroxy-6-metoxy-1,4-benzoquinol methylase